MNRPKIGRATIRPPPVSVPSKVPDAVTEASKQRGSANARCGHAPVDGGQSQKGAAYWSGTAGDGSGGGSANIGIKWNTFYSVKKSRL